MATVKKMNVLICTPIPVEYQAMRAKLFDLQQQFKEGKPYEMGYFKGLHDTFEVILCETGSKNSVVTSAVAQALQYFQPAIALLAGVAGGVKDVHLGDLVVATKAYGYESGKEGADGFVARPEVLPYNKELIELARLISRSADWKKRTGTTAVGVSVFFGPIASGDKVIASKDSPIYRVLKTHYNDTLALEMEAIGFCQAVANFPNVRALNIRSISDLLDYKAAMDGNGSQQVAADHAAAFVFELLYQLNPSHLTHPDMDIKSIAKEVFELVFPLLKLEAVRKIGTDFKDATDGTVHELWQKVKPLFIEETEDLKKDPEDADAQGAARARLRKAMEGDEGLREELIRLLEQVKGHKNRKQVSIKRSKNVVVDGTINVNGDLRIGDDWKH